MDTLIEYYTYNAQMLDFWKRVDGLIPVNKSLKWLCKKTGIPYDTMLGWRAKNRFPPVTAAYQIAKALGTTIEYLLTGIEPYIE